MKQETTGSPRKGLLIAAAATALTVAAGVTAGALFGWVGPAQQPQGDAASTLRAPSAIASESAAAPSETPAAGSASAADPTALAERSRDASEPAAQDPIVEEPAARERGEHERHEHGRGDHERREHERGEREEDDDD